MSTSWVQVTIYPGSYSRLEGAVRSLLPTVVRNVTAQTGASRWFFIRYLDAQGPHLRLRFLVQAQTPQKIEQEILACVEQLLATHLDTEPPQAPRLLPLPPWPEAAEVSPHAQIDTYEPEYDKYGGRDGVALAEALFHHSSETVMVIIEHESQGAVDRPRLALATMLRVAESTLQGIGAIHSFWHRYFHYWSGGDGSHAEAMRRRLMNAAQRRKAAIAKLSGEEGSTDPPLVRSYCQCVKDSLDRAGDLVTVSRSREDLLFHYTHMHNNRLGFLPLEEAYMAALLLTGT